MGQMRKKPRQQRSRQMVDALIEATARAISQRGLEGLTTHHIAEQANVSVGSLYQYFEDKDALVDALLTKLTEEIVAALHRLPMNKKSNLRTNVQTVIRFGFALLNARDGLYLELIRHWHRLPTQQVLDSLQQSFMELSRIYFLMHYQEHPIQDLPVRVFIITNSVIFTMVRYLGQPPMWVSQDDIVQGLTDMVVGYLETPV